MIITSLRTYQKDHTDGRVFVNGDKFGESLEDAGRPTGVKIVGETCIPEGTYEVAITHSNKFGRDMLVLYNVDDDHSIERCGVRFTGIRNHGGNDINHTAGCLMTAINSDKKGKIWGSLESELLLTVKNAIDAGDIVLWVIAEDV